MTYASDSGTNAALETIAKAITDASCCGTNPIVNLTLDSISGEIVTLLIEYKDLTTSTLPISLSTIGYVLSSTLSSNANGAGASTIGVEDAGGNYSSGQLEDILNEIAVSISGISHTAITGIDLKSTGNPNEFLVEIVWTDENGATQTTTDPTPITLTNLHPDDDVESVNGPTVDNTDTRNPIVGLPTAAQVGLGNVDNTSDADKPISSATQAALNGKADTSHNHVVADITDLRLLDSEIIVKTAADLSVIDSSKVYVIDGQIDMGSQSIQVPATGFFYRGLDYFVSFLYSNADNYTMFVDKTGEKAGNVRAHDCTHYVTGVNSQLFDLDNDQNNGAIEFISCNFGDFPVATTSLGEISNYRQFRTSDVGFIRVSDGLTFSGAWAGGFLIEETILLAIPAAATMFKEGTSLVFAGSGKSSINALSVDDTAIVFDFVEANFAADYGFNLVSARFNLNSNPVPNILPVSTKRYFKNCSGVANSFPGGRMEFSTEVLTILTANTPAKALGVTTYFNLEHFTGLVSNEFVYASTVSQSFKVSGQIVVDGGPNDELNIIVRHYDDSAASYVDIGTTTRRVSNVVGGRDIAIFILQYPVVLNLNDRVEIWIENITDNTDATILEDSYIVIDER